MTRTPGLRKPPWLKVRLPAGSDAVRTATVLRSLRLRTVCREARCPNTGECWAAGTATIMILGDRCTRACRFCAVETHALPPPPDPDEPRRVAEGVAALGLRYAVITSVTRDDLPDGGAGCFAETLRELRRRSPATQVELLIPDFGGDTGALEVVAGAAPDVVGHNLETARRLSSAIRDPRTDYDRSLRVLEYLGGRGLETKSALLLGLGETPGEVEEALRDLRRVGVLHVAMGQYLAPTAGHVPVAEYVTPEAFDAWAARARALGFHSVAAGPRVRSSYLAGEVTGPAIRPWAPASRAS
ncbi:MAG: lipoyl synthase [Deltaproteobacteria bacterium]|nr:lipoyl synthase [Deltaproteobacteria bacterium]